MVQEGRRRRADAARWRALAATAVGLAVVALAGPAAAPQETGDLRLADVVVGAGDLPLRVVEGRHGHASLAIVTADSAFTREVRRQVVLDELSRSFQTPDLVTWIDVELVRFPNDDAARALVDPRGVADLTPPDGLPAGVTATVGTDGPDHVERGALLFRGGVALRVEITTGADDAEATAEALLAEVVRIQADRLPTAEAVAHEVRFDSTPLKVEIVSRLLAALIVVQVTSALWTALRDRNVRSRLWRRVRGRPPLPAHARDVDPAARAALRDHRRRIVARSIVTGIVVLVALVAPIGWAGAGAVLLGGLWAWAWIEPRLPFVRRRPGPPAIFRGVALPLGVVGPLVSLVVIVAGLAIVLFGQLLPLFWFGDSDPEDELRLQNVLLVAGVAVMAASAVPSRLSRRVAMRIHARRQRDREGAHILLLRSFADDGIRMRARRSARSSVLDRFALRRWDRFEEVVAIALARAAPVEAVAQPGSRLPPLGAVRQRYGDDEWQPAVRRLAAESRLVVVVVGRTSGVRWEMDHLNDSGLFRRTLYLVPPLRRRERTARLHALAEFLHLDPATLLWDAPGRVVVGVLLPAPGRPLLLTAAAADDVAYEAAVEAALDAIGPPTPGRLVEVADAPPPELVTPRPPAPKGPVVVDGASVRHRPWYRSGWAICLCTFLAVSLGIRTVVELLPAPEDPDVVVDTPFTVAWLVPEPGSERVVVVGHDGTVAAVELDGAGGTSAAVGALALDRITEVAVGEGWVVAADSAHDEVAALDLASGQGWTVTVGDAPRGVAVRDGRAFVALAGADEVVALDLATGAVADRLAVGPVPWDLEVAGDGLVVSLAADAAVVDLGAVPLAERARRPAPVSPRGLAAVRGGVAVVGERRGRLELVDGEGRRPVATSDEHLPWVAAADGRLALTDDRGAVVRLFDDATGRVEREVRPIVPAAALALTADALFVAGGGRDIAVYRL